MELSRLKTLRKIVPGGAFLLFSFPMYKYATDNVFNLDDALAFPIEGIGAVLAFVIGTFFSSLKIRSVRNSKTHEQITDNIKSKLIAHGLTTEIEKSRIEKIKSSRQLMNIFYYFIDNNESLKEKAKLVRDNGLIWTSTADIAILSCLFCWIYFVLILFFEPELLFVSAGLIIGCIGLLSGAILHPRAVKDHIDLGNEQIEFIVTNHKKELQEKVTGLFKEDG